MSDEPFEGEAAIIVNDVLPCECQRPYGKHGGNCPAFYRAVVQRRIALALRAAFEKGARP